MIDDEVLRLIEDAGRLLDYALRPRQYSGKDSEYRQLIDAYQTSSEFREIFQRLARGMYLNILEVSDSALIVGASPESAMARSLSDYHPGEKPEQRILRGLVILGIAAYCFPRERDLDGTNQPRMTAVDVDRFLRQACDRFSREQRDGEGNLEEPDFDIAWRVFKRQPAIKEGDRLSTSTTIGLISQVLKDFAEWGLVREEPGGAGPRDKVYRALPRFRAQIRDLGSKEGFTELARIRSESA